MGRSAEAGLGGIEREGAPGGRRSAASRGGGEEPGRRRVGWRWWDGSAVMVGSWAGGAAVVAGVDTSTTLDGGRLGTEEVVDEQAWAWTFLFFLFAGLEVREGLSGGPRDPNSYSNPRIRIVLSYIYTHLKVLSTSITTHIHTKSYPCHMDMIIQHIYIPNQKSICNIYS